ncbi:MAG: Ig-like domain-containing protein [Methylotenera sp.]|nr:Ig-like domain-containing protein [Methylotenera sp.]
MATAGNDTASVNRYGQTATWDGLGGVDTLYFDSRAWHGIKITLDNAGYIHVDSTTSASGYHITLKNVEHVQYHGVAVDVNGVALTKTGVYYDLTSLFPSAFTTSDTTAPTVTTFSPVDAVTGVAVDANIVVTFSEAVQKGTGLIEIHAGSATGTVVESYEASTSSNLTFSGSTLTINPTANLANSTQYFVTFAAGSVKDLASNIYAGTTAYDFTTIGDYNTINGTTGNDSTLTTGGAGKDHIFGLAGNDVIDGGADADSLVGGAGNDIYIVDNTGDVVVEALNEGTDLVKSSVNFTLSDNIETLTLTGTDSINGTGNTLKNIITGNDSNNVLDGGAGVDKLIGGLGNDTYIIDLTVAGKLEDTITETGGIDTLQLRGTTTNTTAVTLTLAKTLENLNASATVTSLLNLTGNTFDNILTGNAANNVLSGLVGNDTLIGDAGNDKLMGGLGLDNLSGGLGNDTFVFDSALNASTNVDVITDFTSGADKLQLSAKIFAKVKGVKFADVFHDTAITDSHVNNYIIYDSSTGIVSYDADGAGAGAAVQFATLTGLSTLTASDFTVV